MLRAMDPPGPRRQPATRIAVSTHWTELRLAAQAQSAHPDARAAFQAFCKRYWSAVYAVMRSRYAQAEAQDLTQQFFLRHLIERDDLTKLDPARGCFRAWLHTALSRFMIDEWRRRTAPARDERLQAELDEQRTLAPALSTSDYERHYAQAVAERALSALHARWAPRFARRGAQIDQATLVSFLIDRDPQQVARQLGIQPDNARQTVRRLYVDLWQLLEADVAETVSDESSVAAELQEVCRILGIEAPERAGQT